MILSMMPAVYRSGLLAAHYDSKKAPLSRRCMSWWWAGMDSNHRNPKMTDLQSVPFNHSGTYPQYGDPGGIRTLDPLIRSQIL